MKHPVSLSRIYQLAFTSVAFSLAFSLTGCTSLPPSQTSKHATEPAPCNCPTPEKSSPTKPDNTADTSKTPLWTRSDYTRLPNWKNYNVQTWLDAFSTQCETANNRLTKRPEVPTELLNACLKTRKKLTERPNSPALQTWVESNFDVWQFQQTDGSPTGLLTGYYEPEFKGSRTPSKQWIAPLFGVPNDLISIELESVYPTLKGMRLRGRLQGNKVVPYYDRATWNKIGSERQKPLVWLQDKLDAFLLQVQGSGRIQLPDGKVIRLSYANQNGHPYESIGRALVKRGELTLDQASIPGIRAWAEKHPDQLDALLNENPSVVFFTESPITNPAIGPLGALGVPLKGNLSLAIDRTLVPYGSLLWIESTHPGTGKALEQGMLAQDTGGAIRGRVRADYYWGTGDQAGELAGKTRQPLKMWLLWPKGAPLPKVD